MLDYTRPRAGETFDRVLVTVTFMRMNNRPKRPRAAPPPGVELAPARLDVAAYRALYDAVGGRWLWWLRRVMPDELLARHLASPMVAISLLRVEGKVAGFYETDACAWPDVNLNYFGLLPEAMGRGLGRYMLAAAVDEVFAGPTGPAGLAGLRGMTVNTCTADHARALPNYLAAGFVETRRVREVWDIPRRLGLAIPDHLRK